MKKLSSFKGLQSRSSQLGSDTCKCDSHRNVRVLNIFARPFSVRVVQSVLQWGKRPYDGYKEKTVHGRKINANNESVAPKKRKSRQDAKEDKQLYLLFRSFSA